MGVDVFVADLNPDGVADRLRKLGIDDANIHKVSSTDQPIQDLIGAWAWNVTTRVIDELHEHAAPTESLLVSWATARTPSLAGSAPLMAPSRSTSFTAEARYGSKTSGTATCHPRRSSCDSSPNSGRTHRGH